MADGTGADNNRWVFPDGRLRTGEYRTLVDPQQPDIEGWQHTGLGIVELGGARTHRLTLTDREAIVVPLRGGVQVSTEAGTLTLAGRASVFDGPTDVAYLPPGSTAELTASDAEAESLVAVTFAVVPPDLAATEGGSAPVLVAAAEVPVERRGAGQCSRLVRNFGTPDALPQARRIIACEVVTPAGNWSSFPPHKHDAERPGEETELEEIYYFDVSATDPHSGDPVGLQQVYASDDRPIDVLTEVRPGDVVLVPYGWHGPAAALPGYHLYYLNVMAGPGPERAWLISDDPNRGWVRDSWQQQPLDPRLEGMQ
ncbi:5-deoxy-glucuronate isomerase [Nakamurella aerolata]|uniref:5-deoxy-glucuronate isomerase n=1 Tax=Nakamurella aerolata TaxID=1656892 RepID=A0A849A6K3_9ACTN|nr:5-deoxy-glucuronate isomerase [Nakamurella aerolata]NNG34728.1 5-deoxy-glucuronate isomerase [Nakamurella aerolata]